MDIFNKVETKYIGYGTYLHIYCPHCHKSLNVEKKDEKHILVHAKYKGKDGFIKLSPYLNVFEVETDLPLKEEDLIDDMSCPHCHKSFIVNDLPCNECKAPKVAEFIVSAFSKLIPFYICTRYGCTWHGLTKQDERLIKIKIPRQDIPEQDPKLRKYNFNEVPYGYTTEIAEIEAGRCLQCKTPLCIEGCPVNIDIPGFIKLIREYKYIEAARKIKETNSLPAITGRVCPQETQCEIKCVLSKSDKPVAIGRLERFVADYERKMNAVVIPQKEKSTGKNVSIIGSGPSGLTAAADLVKKGHSVTIFESLHEPGGVLTYGIPEFRLPKDIVRSEINYLKNLGVKIELNAVVGKLYSIDEMLNKKGYDAVFIGVGAGLPVFMGIEGENLINIFSANEYLTRINLMRAYKFPEYDTPAPRGRSVAVIGGGNVAMDCARTALRMGADKVTILYRRSEKELPARDEEIHHAMQEGVNFHFLKAPVKYIGDKNGIVNAAECISMKLGEPDDSGRRRPFPIDGSNEVLDFDMIVVAIGAGPNPIVFETAPDIELNRWGYIVADPETGKTKKDKVWAGGDIVTGAATVISAMGAGKVAARSIDEYLRAKKKN